MQNIEDYEIKIQKALESQNRWSESLVIAVHSLAVAMRNLDMPNNDIEALDSCTVLEETRYGKKIAPHPAFKIAKDANEAIGKLLKSLGLTADDISEGIDNDPLAEVTESLIARRKAPKSVKPK